MSSRIQSGDLHQWTYETRSAWIFDDSLSAMQELNNSPADTHRCIAFSTVSGVKSVYTEFRIKSSPRLTLHNLWHPY